MYRTGDPSYPPKGVGRLFCLAEPGDIPDAVLGQLGTAASTRCAPYAEGSESGENRRPDHANPAFSTEQAIQELGTGEALISFLDEKGVRRSSGRWLSPCSRMPVSDDERNGLLNHRQAAGGGRPRVGLRPRQGVQSPNSSLLRRRRSAERDDDGLLGGLKDICSAAPAHAAANATVVQTAAKARCAGVTNQIVRGMLGGLLGGRKRKKPLIVEGLGSGLNPLGLAHQPEAYQEEAGAWQQRADDRRYAVDRISGPKIYPARER